MSKRSHLFDIVMGLAAFAVMAVAPAVTSNQALFDLVIRCSALALFATSLNLLIGYAGMVSFGHGMFFGLGAYGFGLIMQRTSIPIPLALLASLAIAAAVATVVGAICVRLKDIYFAFVTLAFQMLLYSLITSWVSFTGGDQGLRGGIPRPVFFGIDLAKYTHLYLFSSAVLIIGLLAMRHVAESPFGYSLRVIRDNAVRASFLGINVWRMKLAVFVIAGTFAALGGAVMSLFVSGAYPEFANWPMSGEAVFMIMLGGLGVFLGPLAGTVLLLLLNDVITRFTEYYGLALGLVILLFTLGLRKGLLDFAVDLVRRRITPHGALPTEVAHE
jgi:branched-chain amino acid transport system permease protein